MVKNERLTGVLRERAVTRAIKLYGKGTTIRSIAAELDRSYGWVHRALADAGVQFRPRGGNQRGKRASAKG